MRVTREMTIAGVPAITLRNALKYYGAFAWDAESFSETIDVSAEEGLTIINTLLGEGYIELSFEQRGVPCYTATTRGNALANASAAKPITRKTADRLVQEIADRAATINSEASFPDHIAKVYVFGSYLTDRPDLGDVDIAVELVKKCEGDAYTDACLRYAAAQAENGRRLPTFIAHLMCSEADLFKTLRGASRSISIHHASELSELGVTSTKLIYQYP